MSDALYGGQRFRALNVLDEGVREGLAIEIDTSLPAERVIRVLEQVVSWRGQPQAIRLDNGPELIAERFMTWCAERRIMLRCIQPGKPNQNAFIERFNRTYRSEVLMPMCLSRSIRCGRLARTGYGVITRSGSMMRWRAYLQLSTRHNWRLKLLLLKRLVDGEAYRSASATGIVAQPVTCGYG